MRTSFLFIGCIPVLVSLGCYISVADGLEEKDEGLFRKGSTTEEGENPTNYVISHQDQYPEGNNIFERMVEPFGVVVSFKATTNPPT